MFHNRTDAGRQLAAALAHYRGRDDVVVLALPRGGVPVAFEVARALAAPLDVFIVRKLGAPIQPELAMGALVRVPHPSASAESGGFLRFLNDEVVRELAISADEIDRVVKQEAEEIARREQLYRDGRPPLSVAGRIVILIDDGLATGSTMRAAAQALRALSPDQRPARIIAAAPVAATEACAALKRDADEVVCLQTPPAFFAVGQWYADFNQTTDDEVRTLLAQSRAPQ